MMLAEKLNSNSKRQLNLGTEVRSEFPYFEGKKVGGFLDSAASSLKPQCVVDRMSEYLLKEHANIHRGAYSLSAEATLAYDRAREQVAKFLSAPSPDNIIFTRGTTESINLVARSFGELLQKGDNVLLSTLEHHSNIVPWHILKQQKQVEVLFADIDQDACLDLADFKQKLLQHHPKLVSITALSNSFGTKVPIQEVVKLAHSAGAKILIDAAQVVPHKKVSVAEWGADFVAFSGHKMYGPTGIGVLYMTDEMFALLPPFLGGGDMIEEVTLEGTTYASGPRKFEAGTPAISEAIGLGVATQFLQGIGLERIAAHEEELKLYAIEQLRALDFVSLHGPLDERQSSIVTFSVEGIHPHDIATIADTFDVQIRAGHHCAMPALARLELPATARVSFGMYNTRGDVDALVAALHRAREIFA